MWAHINNNAGLLVATKDLSGKCEDRKKYKEIDPDEYFRAVEITQGREQRNHGN